MTPDAADGNTQQGQAAPVPQGMSRPRRSPVKRVRRGEETQGSGRGISACGSSERSGLCVDEGAGREPDTDHQPERRGEGAAHQVTELPKRVHPRLRGYDYSRSGVYFLTLCTQNRLPILSEIVGRGIPDAPLVRLSETGRCVQDAMDYLADMTPKFRLRRRSSCQIMFTFCCASAGRETARQGCRALLGCACRVLSPLSSATPTACAARPLWQASYHDHIIRDENDLLNHWSYIEHNPARWAEDEYHV